MEYFVYMTNDCNLHCQYCSVLLDCKTANLPIKPVYSNSKLASFIKQVQKENDETEANIYFFGGEPTMEYSNIEKLVCDLKQELPESITLKFVLHTNGLLLDRIPSNLLENLSLILFSINYEKIPKYNLGDGYFSTVIQNTMITKQKRNIPIIARLTITEKTSLYTEILQIANYFDLVYWQIENCIKFNDYNTFYKTYTFEIEQTFDYWFKYLQNGFLIKLVPFMAVLKFMFFPDRPDDIFSCGYSRSMIYIQTDGNCYACSDNVESGVHNIGNIQSGVKLKKLSLKDLRCLKCKYKRLCMGRCGRMHIEFSDKHISEYCQMNQFMFDLFINNKSELSGILKKYSMLENELKSWLLEYTEFTP